MLIVLKMQQTDLAIFQILSFLSFKDLTRVGAVSKRCRQFHLSVPVLSFDYSSCKPRGVTNQKIVKLMSPLDRYLCYRGDHRMQVFSINWSCFGSEQASKFSDDHFRVITWIVNAVRCNVEVLDLRLACDFLALPSCVFLSKSLQSLSVHLTWMILEAPSVSFSSNLCYLKLEKVTIVDERFFKWISRSCKFLKELQLIWVWIRGMRKISIESFSLESLLVWINDPNPIHLNISGQKIESIDISFKDYHALTSSIEVNIFAPNLKYLKWEGILNNSLNLGKLTGLEKVEIFLASQRNKFDEVFEKFDKVFEFLHSVRWAKVLIINEETMKAFKEGSMSAPLDNIRKLGIHCSSLKDDLVPAMVSLVRGMTNLNSLYIKTLPDGGDTKSVVSSGFGMGYWKLQNLAFVRQLKEVTIEPSTGSNEIEFARYILEHSQNLKKMFLFLHHGAEQSKVAGGMVSRSKMISTATIVIRGSGMQNHGASD
ncbi:PREDICTED: F-box/FBD/LRR-repeat protein At2g26030-like [Prunus mume]|uniref:F-box/FBD/LRR-repeat protein At2g26030-like n=1 Tax=Prunus mume TaxID=102107 RepID=A0ABM0PBD4_PRUMU|nr:PREDICTED: F-box/FBD/LRR-repeat protein At2g26030-like [Prunus mume]